MRLKKADKKWLEDVCGVHADNTIALVKSYIKQTKEWCKYKRGKGFMVYSNNISENTMMAIIADTLLENTNQEQLHIDLIKDWNVNEDEFSFKYGGRRAIYTIKVTID